MYEFIQIHQYSDVSLRIRLRMYFVEIQIPLLRDCVRRMVMFFERMFIDVCSVIGFLLGRNYGRDYKYYIRPWAPTRQAKYASKNTRIMTM